MAFYALQCFKKIIFFSRFIYKLSLKKCLHYYTHCYKITNFFIRNANCMDVQQKFLFQNLFKQKKVFVREKWCQRDDKVRKLLCWRNADKLWDYLSKNCWNFSYSNADLPSQEIRCRVTITNESKKVSILFCLLHHNLQCLKNHILKLLNQRKISWLLRSVLNRPEGLRSWAN